MSAQSPWLKLQNLIDRFGISDPDERDVVALRKAIVAACAMVERDLGRRVAITTYVRRFDGNGQTYMPLPFAPIATVSLLQIDTTQVVIGDADQAYDTSSIAYNDPSMLYLRTGFPQGRHNVRVEWESGYELDAIPSDLIDLTETAAMILFKEKRRGGEKGKNAGKGGSVEFLRDLEGLELKALDMYRDWRTLYVDPGIPLPGDGGSELGVFLLGWSELG